MGAGAIPHNSQFLLVGEDPNKVSQHGHAQRAALLELREKGFNSMAMIRWSSSTWKSKTRGTGARIPLDLREAYERSFLIARVLGDLVDGWEIDNEPDIGFVTENPETFAAFFKACSLGIIAGRQANVTWQRHYGTNGNLTPNLPVDASSAASLVIHAPLALPPGPYWRELRRNDTLSYAEGSNYHFYGYPEDFRGVRDAWIAALDSKSKPLFISEYGYGLLDRFDRNTRAGRLRQRRFFDLTLPSITDGKVTGAMAYQLAPWEGPASQNEFGLLAKVSSSDHQNNVRGLDQPSGIKPSIQGENKSFLELTGRVSLSIATQRAQLENLSPVVIDFLPGENLRSVKRYRGHVMKQLQPPLPQHAPHSSLGDQRRLPAARSEFKLVFYNFSEKSVSGRLSLSIDDGHVVSHRAATLAPASPPQSNSPAPSKPAKATRSPRPLDRAKGSGSPPSYMRPARPRSTQTPAPIPDWPTKSTPLVRLDDKTVFAVTPALELLWHATGSQPAIAPSRAAKTSPIAKGMTQLLEESPPCFPDETSSPTTLTLAPGERREISWHLSLRPSFFQGHRLDVRWIPDNKLEGTSRPKTNLADAVLSTLVYPPPSSFRSVASLGTDQRQIFDFSAEQSRQMHRTQQNRVQVVDEAKLAPLPTAPRWLTTPGVEIEDSALGWKITIRDLPASPLRPAEVELPLARSWRPGATSALSFRYQLLPTPTDLSEGQNFDKNGGHPDRLEEFDVNFRDEVGTLWGVWPRLVARRATQSYFEPLENFTPMFFSRAAHPGVQQLTDTDAVAVRSLVLMIRPRSLPMTLWVTAPRIVTPVTTFP